MKTPVQHLNKFHLNHEEVVLESGKLLIKMWRSVIEDSAIVRDGVQYAGVIER